MMMFKAALVTFSLKPCLLVMRFQIVDFKRLKRCFSLVESRNCFLCLSIDTNIFLDRQICIIVHALKSSREANFIFRFLLSLIESCQSLLVFIFIHRQVVFNCILIRCFDVILEQILPCVVLCLFHNNYIQ